VRDEGPVVLDPHVRRLVPAAAPPLQGAQVQGEHAAGPQRRRDRHQRPLDGAGVGQVVQGVALADHGVRGRERVVRQGEPPQVGGRACRGAAGRGYRRRVHAISTQGLTKRFGRTLAVDDLTLDVVAGEVFGFLGPNGAGKSTTIRLLLGLLHPSAGSAAVFGDAAGDVARAHRHLAYVPADVALWPSLTGAEALELLGNLGPGVDTAYRAELVDRFELDLDKRGGAYSSGNRQKVAIVAAFATRAPLLVLDEPTSGLDPLMERAFRTCVTEAADRGQTVFLSSHQLREVEAVCSRVGILRRGRLVEVAGVAELRRLRRTEVEVTFAGRPPALGGVAGVSDVRLLPPASLALSLTGPPGPALRAIAAADVTALQVREPTLEEIFLEYYGQEPAATTPAGQAAR
jgi:ABC-2 type transport system ATP-binding protein